MGDFLGTYDPKDVTLVVGATLISGFAAGTYITVARADNEIYKTNAGAKGEVGRTKNNNSIGTVTFMLKQTSPSRQVLDVLKNSPETFPVLVKNNSDQKYMAAGADAWVKTDPDEEFGDEETNAEWVIECADLNKSTLP